MFNVVNISSELLTNYVIYSFKKLTTIVHWKEKEAKRANEISQILFNRVSLTKDGKHREKSIVVKENSNNSSATGTRKGESGISTGQEVP